MRHVYFLQESEGGSIKIGLTCNIGKRISQIQNAMPHNVVLIGLMDGDWEFEKELHEKFKTSRLRGEWFRPDKHLLDYIEANAKLREVPIDLAAEAKRMEGCPLSAEGEECKKLMNAPLPENMEEAMQNTMLSVEQVARLLAVSPATIRNWDKSGKLPSVRTHGNHRRYRYSDIHKVRKQMMMGAEFVIPDVKVGPMKEWLEYLKTTFGDDTVDVSITHDTFMNKVKMTFSSSDGLTTVAKSFNIKE